MANAIRLVSINRGLDPRDFTLVGFGGAGPLHAVALADELSIRSVLIPPAPGNVSAMGLLTASVRHEIVRTRVVPLAGLDPEELKARFEPLLEQAREILAGEKAPFSGESFHLTVDLRYAGQNYELNLPVGSALFGAPSLQALIDRFHAQHRVVYGYDLPERTVQLVNIRVTAIGEMEAAAWPRTARPAAAAAPVATRRLALPGRRSAEASVYRFTDLGADQQVSGPAIVEYPGSTLFVPPGWIARYDEYSNARVDRTGHA
jgi:N-methylhydantoinase A